MRVLFLALSNSVHTARWINQLSGQGWDIHLFPSIDIGLFHPELPAGVKTYRATSAGAWRPVRVLRKLLLRRDHFAHLCDVIRSVRPDIIHTMEIQHAGYLGLAAKRALGPDFPTWLVTNWGSDIYHFGKFPEHAPRIRETLASCDYYSCETQRDVRLGREFGFKGRVLPVFPNSGGFDLEKVRRLRSPAPPSQRRRKIMLKGYQGWAGRALVALEALEKCVELLSGYELCIYVPEIEAQARAFARRTGVKVKFLPWTTPHEEMLWHHGSSRVSIGLSISDAISTSLLEALIMGSFPIQSDTGGAAEWVEDGKTCLLVPPEDREAVARAVRRALVDDAFIDSAARSNIEMAERQLSSDRIAPMAREIYTSIAQERRLAYV